MRRQIDPPLVIVHRVDAAGYHRAIEYVPPDADIARVLVGHVPNARALIDTLEAAGFFDWPDTSLVPPAEFDVDSDPLVIVLDTGSKSRRVFTRDPRVPPSVQALIDTLHSRVDGMRAVDSCLVCIPTRMRVFSPDSYEVADTSEAWTRELRRSLLGPFPVVVPYEDAMGTSLREHKEFSIRANDGIYIVRCLDWP